MSMVRDSESCGLSLLGKPPGFAHKRPTHRPHPKHHSQVKTPSPGWYLLLGMFPPQRPEDKPLSLHSSTPTLHTCSEGIVVRHSWCTCVLPAPCHVRPLWTFPLVAQIVSDSGACQDFKHLPRKNHKFDSPSICQRLHPSHPLSAFSSFRPSHCLLPHPSPPSFPLPRQDFFSHLS